MNRFAKLAASALFSASLITFGAADPVLDTAPAAYAMSAECRLPAYLERIWNGGNTDYTITSLDYGTVRPYNGFDAQLYIQSMLDGSWFEEVKPWEAPEGQYVILEFHNQGMRFEFFYGKDGNYIKQISGGASTVYHVHFPGDMFQASQIIEDWGRELSGR